MSWASQVFGSLPYLWKHLNLLPHHGNMEMTSEPILKKRERPTDKELADIQGEHLVLVNRCVADPYRGEKLLGDLWAERIMRDQICAAYEELKIMHSRDKEATIKAERAADAHIKKLEDRIKQREERIHELSREITNYLNNGYAKLRARVRELEREREVLHILADTWIGLYKNMPETLCTDILVRRVTQNQCAKEIKAALGCPVEDGHVLLKRGPDYVVEVQPSARRSLAEDVDVQAVLNDLKTILALNEIDSVEHAQIMLRNLIEELSDD